VTNFEVLWCAIKIQNSPYLVGCVYRAPGSSCPDFFGYLDDVLKSKSRRGKQFIITREISCNLLDKTSLRTMRAVEFHGSHWTQANYYQSYEDLI